MRSGREVPPERLVGVETGRSRVGGPRIMFAARRVQMCPLILQLSRGLAKPAAHYEQGILSVRKKVACGFRLLFVGSAMVTLAFAGGCGGSPDGTSVKFDPQENKKQQDAMRDGMMKSMNKMSGANAPGKK
jgi:hypothetical protein